MDWIYKGKTFVPPEDFAPEKMYGFIYQVTNTVNNKKYIGKKFFYSSKTIKYSHAIWHLFVLGGSATHFFFVLFFVI